ncbi:MAG: hypothetical protein JWQ27_585 [Ferruginibacter sp.]|nr:hypothetical protein [Ferruginibacter sp.]
MLFFAGISQQSQNIDDYIVDKKSAILRISLVSQSYHEKPQEFKDTSGLVDQINRKYGKSNVKSIEAAFVTDKDIFRYYKLRLIEPYPSTDLEDQIQYYYTLLLEAKDANGVKTYYDVYTICPPPYPCDIVGKKKKPKTKIKGRL